ncbi:MAG: TrkH family potassium uptake protein [Phycisphaerales bacterium]|nr:TrkH family potassium uptake protein [Phycisphaerales bacterium]
MLNVRYVLNQFGLLCIVLSAVQLVIAAWGWLQVAMGHAAEGGAANALALSAAGGIVVGGVLWLLTRTASKTLERREALLLVAMGWLVGAALAGLPFFVWALLRDDVGADHPFRSPINCYFEAMSGLTTTGATVLTGIGELPKSILLWRAMTHWLGGLGIVVLFVAVLPSLGAGGKKLFRVEAPGPEPEGVHPHIRETARILWFIYAGLTVGEMIALRIAGMSWFDSVCHTFATLATGGFSTRDASIGAYNSSAVDIIIIVFMIFAGVNFGLYYRLIRRRFASVWKDTELRVYLAILLIGSALVSLAIMSSPIELTTGEAVEPSVAGALRHGVFTAVSVQTTTGFCSADFNQWPYLAKAVLILLMFVGASAGSTGGGIKVIRIWITAKVILAEIERAFRPNVVRPIKIGGASLDPQHRLGTIAYVLGIVLIFAFGTFALIVFEQASGHTIDLTTAGSASVATLCNIGPGLGAVGAVENYADFTGASKIVMSALMALGRLEVFALAILFFPRFWSGD